MMEHKHTSLLCRDLSGASRLFHYFLLVDLEGSGPIRCESYGVRISEEGGATAFLAGITTDPFAIEKLMALLVDSQVGPLGLEAVVEDWLAAEKDRTGFSVRS